jgi:hypothetical protein
MVSVTTPGHHGGGSGFLQGRTTMTTTTEPAMPMACIVIGKAVPIAGGNAASIRVASAPAARGGPDQRRGRSDMRGTQRLLIVIVAAVAAIWLLWPYYYDALDQIGHQLRNNGSGDARAADDMPRPYRRMKCTGSIWSDKLQCGPRQDDPAPEDRRGGGRW